MYICVEIILCSEPCLHTHKFRLFIFSVDQKMITAPVSQTSEGMDLTIPESERPGGFEAMHNKR